MTDLRQQIDDIPVTLVILVGCITMAMLTDPFSPTSQQLREWGGLSPYLAANGEPWRLLSSGFLHGGLVHIAFNMSALMSLGPALERALGSLRFLLLYTVSLLGGSIVVCLSTPVDQPVVGASGALFGLLGALVAMNMAAGRHMLSFLDYEGPRRLLGMIGIYLLLGFLLPFISNEAHIGGLLAGFFVTLLWIRPVRTLTSLRPWRVAFAALLASLLLASIYPPVRSDTLWAASFQTTDLRRQNALRRAAAMSYFRRADVTAADVEAFYQVFILGKEPGSEPTIDPTREPVGPAPKRPK
ncbi:MAG: rhomboid family intramembrane serine protease [Planctomycetes bacterium]|nr:rhomboid family intramembrane serine protease [Planctomycetota bacterium]